MRAGKWLAVAVAVGSISTGVAVAGGGSADTEPVSGTFNATPKHKPQQRKCDANHVRVNARFTGEQDSNDMSLVGDIEINAESVIDTGDGWGRTEGDVKIRERGRHGKTKFRGKFIGVVEPDGGVEGFITGETKSAHLFANFNADQNPDGSISGEFGNDSQEQKPYAPMEEQDPAVLTDACFKGHGHGHGH